MIFKIIIVLAVFLAYLVLFDMYLLPRLLSYLPPMMGVQLLTSIMEIRQYVGLGK